MTITIRAFHFLRLCNRCHRIYNKGERKSFFWAYCYKQVHKQLLYLMLLGVYYFTFLINKKNVTKI